MSKSLWVASVSFEFVVLAGDQKEAMEKATEYAFEDMENHQRDCVDMVRPLSSLGGLPVDWDGQCIPWGSEDDRTCAEVLADSGTEG